jgi:hypothetical protein
MAAPTARAVLAVMIGICFGPSRSFAIVDGSNSYNWAAVDKVLTSSIANGVFPGCAAAVTTPDGSVVLLKGYGSYVYPGQTTPGASRPAVLDA